MTIMAQCRSRLTTDPGPRFEQCVEDALALLHKAADTWAKGHPETPPTSEVLQDMLRLFEKAGFLKKPW
jgi:hypothetical protein